MKVDPSRILGSRSGLESGVLGHSSELYENDRLPSYAFGRVLKKVSPFSVVFSLLNHLRLVFKLRILDTGYSSIRGAFLLLLTPN